MNFDFFGNISFYIIVAIILAIAFVLHIISLKTSKKKNRYKNKDNFNDENSKEKAKLNSEVKRLNFLLKEYKEKLNIKSKTDNDKDKNITKVEKNISEKQIKDIFEEKNKFEEEKEKFQKRNKKLWEQSIAIHKEKERIDLLRKEVEKHYKEVTDSIKYAERIQTALMPSQEILQEYIPNNFVLWKARDIVSGDFYWTKKIENLTYIVASDCTGHGVPGALMSMLGMSFLNEIIKNNELSAGQILDNMRANIKKSLSQTGAYLEQKDGMDMALCIINSEENTMQYAGANNHLYFIRNKELTRYRADNMPIGIYRKENPFKNNDIQLQKNDIFYIFSDGYQDQFGGEKGAKFKSGAFKKLLLEIHEKPMKKQKQILEDNFNKWKGEIPQVDDVLVIGIKY